MKICFVQKQLFPYLGVTALSGLLRSQGHETDVLIDAVESDLCAALEKIKPDLIGFSLLSTEHNWLKRTAPKIKASLPGVPTIAGGVHVILYPGSVLELDGIDYICNGEAEIALPLLMERIEKGEGVEGVEGIGYCVDGRPVLQGAAPLIQDLDSFTEDRSVYIGRYPKLNDSTLKYFFASRGCPYKCTFCANPYLVEVFKDSGKYIRRKSPGHLIEEIRSVVERYGATTLVFSDDLFVSNLKWLEEFAPLYKSEIGLPYFFTVRAGTITRKHAELLASSGAHTASVGVETGNESLRQKILKKSVTDEDIAVTIGMLKENGMKVQTSNMFCLPGETVEDAVATIEFNIRLGVDYTYNLLFLPFPKTELADYCIENGFLEKDYSFEDMPESFIRDSVMVSEGKDAISNLQKVAYLCLKFPRLKPSLIRLARSLRFKSFFFVLYLLGTLIRYKDEKSLKWIEAIRFLWSFRKGA